MFKSPEGAYYMSLEHTFNMRVDKSPKINGQETYRNRTTAQIVLSEKDMGVFPLTSSWGNLRRQVPLKAAMKTSFSALYVCPQGL